MPFTPDSWERLRAYTNARIALGRAGGSLPTAACLDFRLAHARARDAVWKLLDVEALAEALAPLPTAVIASRAWDHQTFLRRPDLGRGLAVGEADKLAALRAESGLSSGVVPADLAIVISGGLSAAAVEEQVPALLKELLPRLDAQGLAVAPLILVRLGRVALADEIGAALGARAALILLGERPGLATPASLGAYLTFGPRPGRSDADRNCVSNIHAAGLLPAHAAHKLAWLVAAALRLSLTGVGLKDESADPAGITPPQDTPKITT